MHIKSVTLEGFKSYKSKTVIGPLHEGFNVVVGRNGSGKSNFFAAIEFVLSEEYGNLKQDQRCSLLSSSGSGPRPLSAYVELLFDNSDRRFPINQDEISLRRTIGAKKDQFHLNGKVVLSRKELSGMLEAAGFSRSNPFYIVKQGQINSLATCSDKRRLEIVNDLAGTQVYVDKKKESEVELQSAETTISKVSECIEKISDRLEELEGERELLKEFKKLDLKKRTIEYLVVTKDLTESRSKFQLADREYQELVESFKESNEKFKNLKSEVQSSKAELSKSKKLYSTIVDNLHEAEKLYDNLIKSKEAKQLKLDDLMTNDDDGDSALSLGGDAELKIQEDELKELIRQRDNVEASLMKESAAVDKLRQELELVQHEMNELSKKSGRMEMFSSKSERDEWINKEIESNSHELEKRQLELASLKEEFVNCKSLFDTKVNCMNECYFISRPGQ